MAPSACLPSRTTPLRTKVSMLSCTALSTVVRQPCRPLPGPPISIPGCGEAKLVIERVLPDGVFQPDPAVLGVDGRDLEFDGESVTVELKFHGAVGMPAQPDDPSSDQGIDVELQGALDCRSPALSSAARSAHIYSSPLGFILN
jgi:hypothetical protein